jgi:threonine/homoserine/homoserine lactone efflux protein
MGAFLQGILMGLTITVSLGPGFIALFQTSVVKGVKAGFVMAVGILISDLTLISISYFGIANLIHKDNYQIMGLVAGLILIITGAIYLVRKTSLNVSNPKKIPNLKSSLSSLLIKGFLLNLANPFCLIFWIGIMGFAANNYGMHSYRFFIFFFGLLLTAFSSDLLKCYLSGSLKKILASKAIVYLNKAMGLALMLIGLFIIYKVL